MDEPEVDHVVPTMDQKGLASGPPADRRSQAALIDDSNSMPDYANFCRISGTPEELVIDFGFNPQPTGATMRTIAVTQRVITGWHTAKRLLFVLQQVVGRHEATFGDLETDIQKRIGRT